MTTGRPKPVVYLKFNPWNTMQSEDAALGDDALGTILLKAALAGEGQIKDWIDAEEAKADAAFALVLLDPTNPRTQTTIQERIFAVVFYGDEEKARGYLPNAQAKADATERVGDGYYSNGRFVAESNFRLSDRDFAYGESATFEGAIAGGSGLSQRQDGDLAGLTLEIAMTEIHDQRTNWLAPRRENGGRQGWYNPANTPGDEYLLELDASWKVLTTES